MIKIVIKNFKPIPCATLKEAEEKVENLVKRGFKPNDIYTEVTKEKK